MNQRVTSGIVIVVVTVATILIGGIFLKLAGFLICLYGSYELVKCIRYKFDILSYIITVLISLLIYIDYNNATLYALLGLLIMFIVSIFSEEREIDDLSLLLVMSLILSASTHYFIYLSQISKWLLGFAFIIAYITDAFSFYLGSRFGKHKLNERVSPNKTIEGSIFGWLGGFLVSFLYALLFNYFGLNKNLIIVFSLFLPLVSQIGDLAFSLLKRHYGIKDFSNLIPGHGGLLDRIDSVSYVCLLMGIVLTFIG